MKKTLALLLALLTLLPLALGCQSGDGETDQTTAPDDQDSTQVTEDPTADEVPEMDLKEWNYIIGAPGDGTSFFNVEEDAGDTISSAIYSRNRQLEKRFNIIISSVQIGGSDNMATAFLPYSLSKEDVVSTLGVTFTQSAKPLITEELILPWNDVDHIDLDKVYWNKSVTQTISILGNYYFLSGYTNWSAMATVSAWFFNKTLATSHQIPDLYQAVRDGKWTHDLANTYIKQLTNESSGDGQWDEKDTYGLLQFTSSVESWLSGSNYQTIYMTDTGVKMNYNTYKMQEIITKLHEMIYLNHEAYVSPDNDLLANIFFGNRALFVNITMDRAAVFRAYDGDFGIIPNPKYDEEQKDYYTQSDQWGMVLALPGTVTDKARVGAVTEAMNSLSYRTVRPAYYEKTLLGKIKRDDESEEMLDIIFSGILYDTGWVYLTNLNWLPLRATALAGKPNITSWWKEYSGVINDNYDELYDAVKKQQGTPETAA